MLLEISGSDFVKYNCLEKTILHLFELLEVGGPFLLLIHLCSLSFFPPFTDLLETLNQVYFCT
ncbi:unnamed protein product [Coffea canephora]|uniref:Uncharacterized protein n=1 Tax=Coffea canephora TaxID=49390 RepID=A0A068VBP0_COFCA|nr:unnamed protein product [Coffea canephora]